MTTPERAIVAFNPCGCWAGTIMEHSPSAAEWTKGWVIDKCRVELMSVEDARAIVARCSAHPRPALQVVPKVERQEVLL